MRAVFLRSPEWREIGNDFNRKGLLQQAIEACGGDEEQGKELAHLRAEIQWMQAMEQVALEENLVVESQGAYGTAFPKRAPPRPTALPVEQAERILDNLEHKQGFVPELSPPVDGVFKEDLVYQKSGVVVICPPWQWIYAANDPQWGGPGWIRPALRMALIPQHDINVWVGLYARTISRLLAYEAARYPPPDLFDLAILLDGRFVPTWEHKYCLWQAVHTVLHHHGPQAVLRDELRIRAFWGNNRDWVEEFRAVMAVSPWEVARVRDLTAHYREFFYHESRRFPGESQELGPLNYKGEELVPRW